MNEICIDNNTSDIDTTDRYVILTNKKSFSNVLEVLKRAPEKSIIAAREKWTERGDASNDIDRYIFIRFGIVDKDYNNIFHKSSIVNIPCSLFDHVENCQASTPIIYYIGEDREYTPWAPTSIDLLAEDWILFEVEEFIPNN